ncbi:pentatricopeptide repeat-containing protein At5g08305-like [Magnolia sinica]|uniref:pentatricopeptide repeat-containing protein At5g08305-like n=1 Tax=Magnolia sinica TaxID=86752 RepID=UPI002658E9F6|nr:pentatricopeptide repeat-containing protein At5g08305-like [Magnolia sinica]
MIIRNPHRRHSLICLLDRCKSMRELKRIHAQIVVSGLSDENYLASKILSFSAISESGDIDYSGRVFNQLQNPNIFIWNTIIRGHSISKNPNLAISIFTHMLRVGISPDYLTFPFLAKSCARLTSSRLGSAVHCHIAKSGIEIDIFIQNSLVHMYSSCSDIKAAQKVFDEISRPSLVSWNAIVDGHAKCGDLIAARRLFELMPERDVVSWSALIAGYVKGGDHREALATFERMQAVGARANEVTMVSVLCACAHLGALEQGRRIHDYIKDNSLKLTLVLSTSLVDMYAKCGSIKEAWRVFHAVPLAQTDVLIWNAMIGGLATNGLSKEALDLFDEMQSTGIAPDEITYLGLLCACAHGGLVEDAWRFFKSLDANGMTPKTEHYACMIDTLGRAGCLDAAYEFVNTMPVEPTASMLGALLSGCRTHGRADLGEVIGKKLIELEPDHDGRYIGLSNVYAAACRWDDAKTMREAMEKRGVKKVPGFSSLEVDGTLHRFIAHDRAHPQSLGIYSMLNDLGKQMKLEGACQTQPDNHLYDIGEDG